MPMSDYIALIGALLGAIADFLAAPPITYLWGSMLACYAVMTFKRLIG